MIKHMYCFRLKEREKAKEIADHLMTLREHIPYMVHMEVGIDFKGVSNSWDLVEVCVFQDMDDFLRFGANEYHAGIRAYMSDKFIESCKVDYEIL